MQGKSQKSNTGS